MAPAHTLRTVYRRVRGEAGFTLIEVLVTVLVLVVGLLGAFATLRASAHATVTNRQRQVETSLAREVIEDAGSLPYAQLTTAALPGALQALVAHASPASGGLQVTRGPASYLVTLDACSIDDPSDGYGSHTNAPASGGAWCPNQSSGTADTAPDDEKRVSVTVGPSTGATGPIVQQAALVFSQGLPAVSCLTVVGTACPDSSQRVSYSSTSTLTFSVTTTTQASSVRWLVDGNNPTSGQLPTGASDPYAPTGTTSQFAWQVPQVAGTYRITVETQDAQGDTGPPSTLQITVTS